MNIVGLGMGESSVNAAAQSAMGQQETRKFQSLIDGIRAGMQSDTPSEIHADSDVRAGSNIGNTNISSSQIISDGRLPGDVISSFTAINPTEADTHAAVRGAAANSGQKGTIDKTSKLYEKALELESYMVKMMLSSMRSTVNKSDLFGGKDNFAQNTYEDMLYDELATTLTKTAGFGLADQVYLQLQGSNT